MPGGFRDAKTTCRHCAADFSVRPTGLFYDEIIAPELNTHDHPGDVRRHAPLIQNII